VEIEAFCRAERQRRGDGGYVWNTSNNEVTPGAQQDLIVKEELRKLRNEIQISLKDLEKKIANVSAKETSTIQIDVSKQGKFPFKCHHCGKNGHMLKDCFLKNNQDQAKMRNFDLKNPTSLKENTDSQKKNASIVSSTTALKVDQDIQESGLFVKAIVNGTQCYLLLDTGATLTILSDRVYAEIDKSSKIGLSPITQRIVGADGTLLTVQGKGLFYIKFGSQEFKTQAVIANIKTNGIIGLDFLQTNQCLVDLCKTKMYVHG
jgi:predicted aspartyl protease